MQTGAREKKPKAVAEQTSRSLKPAKGSSLSPLLGALEGRSTADVKPYLSFWEQPVFQSPISRRTPPTAWPATSCTGEVIRPK